jgi:bacterial/archaeal transporter family-2 protein
MNWWIALLGLTAGAAVAVQFTVNAQLKIATNDPIWAALISFLVGSSALALGIIIQRRPLIDIATMATAPGWIWLGGVCGALYVCSAIVIVPRAGVAVLAGLVVTGQLLTALLLDNYGWFRTPVAPLSFTRGLGASLIVLGLLVMRMK